MFHGKITSFILFLFIKQISNQNIQTGPSNSKTRVGDTVTLMCDPDSYSTYLIIWYHESSRTQISKNRDIVLSTESKRQRYSITGRTYGDQKFDLTITEFAKEDAGFYSCNIIDEENNGPVLDSALALISIDPPGSMTAPTGSVTCFVNTKDVDTGDDIIVGCQCKGGNPMPTLSLIINGIIQKGGSTIEINQTYSLEKTIRLDQDHIDTPFQCKMVSAALKRPEFCQFIPLPTVAIIPSAPSVTDEERVLLTCKARGIENPSFEWILNEPCNSYKRMLGDLVEMDVLEIMKLPLAFNGCNITCVVKSVGEATVTIEVFPRSTTLSKRDTNDSNSSDINEHFSTSLLTLILTLSVTILIILTSFIVCILFRKRKIINLSRPKPSIEIENETNVYEGVNEEESNVCARVSISNFESKKDIENGDSKHNESTGNNSNMATYENLQLTCNAATTSNEQTQNDVNNSKLNYVDLDLTQSTSSMIHNNIPQTMYSDIILP